MGIKALKGINVERSPARLGGGTGGGSGGAGQANAAEEELEEPLSPGARLFHAPKTNCCIIAIMGSKTKIDVDAVKDGLMNTLIKHPRFSSKLVVDPKKCRKPVWVRVTVNLENHIVVPDLDPDMDLSDQFVEDYISDLTKIPMDVTKPLWELHLLNIKTSDADATGVFRIHHSLGDGISLISLLLACTRKSSNLEALPSIAATKKTNSGSPNGYWRYLIAIWMVLKLMWNTFIHAMIFFATVLFLKDTDTPIKGTSGIEKHPKRIVHRTVSLDDIKFVKKEMNITINDVILGVTQAGVSHYLNKKYSNHTELTNIVIEETNYLPKNIRLRATLMVNIRPSTIIQDLADVMEKGSENKWGNAFGFILVPFHIALHDDPLDYLWKAKATIDRKKFSLEAKFTHFCGKLIVKIFGPKVAAALVYRGVANTTMSFSSIVGPSEEITFCGHQMGYLAPTVYGHPQALTIHFQSYADKMIIVLAVDEGVIPDPHTLCGYLEKSLELIKNAVIERRHNNGYIDELPNNDIIFFFH
ncbi:hypothetical protein Nepgr_010738 [Nepenthes gracilis]|uniref:Diacylglycerol O-acyltransferase n=1 Tax=Nepenthes gracilis TaxID=150966 RepID=A0AAD3SCY2_NEPGR|nr:hypothetical protein Nepgr_010738 [Nepenthes gracilis]